MGKTIAQKILASHLLSGQMRPGEELALRIDQTLTQDATGTLAYLAFETLQIDRVKTELSVAYVDHNTLQCGSENADDHKYLQSVAAKYGVIYSPPGNGICHQVHLEHFGKPGKTLIGSDSHTPTAGGLGMLAFGAGGMDVAVAMGGGAYYIHMPKLYRVNLTGSLRPSVAAKDVALELLRRLTVKGGVGALIEWGGPGVKTLTVPERATIANMGAELGATTTIFPSDEQTRSFLAEQGRLGDYIPLEADADAEYDKIISIDLSELEPMVACPHSPDNVVSVGSLHGIKVDQVCIGSCTNSSLPDLLNVAAILRGKTVAPGVSLAISPGSRQVLHKLAQCGALLDILNSGARILECACGPCIGMGLSPNSGGVSLRTFNRNFQGRSGTKDAQVYLVSAQTAALSALTGYLTSPLELTPLHLREMSDRRSTVTDGFIKPLDADQAASAKILRGPNIKPFPESPAFADELRLPVLLKVGDHITTDHIMPAGAKVLPYRSNVPALSQFCFAPCDTDFVKRAEQAQGGVILAGENYGQGSSREHAAIVPMYLGVRCVLAKSYARIHVANLINAGILPLLIDAQDYDALSEGSCLQLKDLRNAVETGTVIATQEQTGAVIRLRCELTQRQKQIVLAGGLLRYIRGENND